MKTLLILVGLLCGVAAHADTDPEVSFFSGRPIQVGPTQVWPTIILDKKTDDVDAMITVQPRVNVDGSGPKGDQVEFIALFGWRITSEITAWVGYQSLATDPFMGDTTLEHAIVEQLTNEVKFGKVSFQNRLRGEQRFLDGVDEIAWRIRDQFRISIPLTADGNWQVRTGAEFFVNLNDAGSKVSDGFDQARLYMGIMRKINGQLSLELGYLNQTKGWNGSGDIKMANVIQCTMTWKF